MIASFLGVLELMKVRKLLISGDMDDTNALLDGSTRFILNDEVNIDEISE